MPNRTTNFQVAKGLSPTHYLAVLPHRPMVLQRPKGSIPVIEQPKSSRGTPHPGILGLLTSQPVASMPTSRRETIHTSPSAIQKCQGLDFTLGWTRRRDNASASVPPLQG